MKQSETVLSMLYSVACRKKQVFASKFSITKSMHCRVVLTLRLAAYIHLLDSDDGSVTYGVGVSSNITRASVRAIFSAMNRLGIGK